MVIMKNALIKDAFREIRRTLSKFLSIFAIVALGVAFFAGIKATCPDMKITADKYFDDYRLMDIKLISTMGFNEDDINTIKKVPGVEGVLPAYSIDTIVNVDKEDLVIKVLSFPVDKVKNPDESYINRVKLVEGRYPEKPGECLAEKGKMLNPGIAIGSKLKLNSGESKDINESLKNTEYTIVGFIETPYYISFERGTSSIGNGRVNSFIMVPKEDFKMPVYTEVFLTVKGAKELYTYGDDYTEIIKPVKKALEDKGKVRADIRYEEIVSEANKKLQDSRNEIKEAEDKQKSELKKAEEKLQYAKIKIASGEKELQDKERYTDKSLSDGEAKIADGYKQLQAGYEQYNIQLENFNAAKAQAEKEFISADEKINAAEKQINEYEIQLNGMKQVLAENQNLSEDDRAELEAKIKAYDQQLIAAKQQLEAAKVQLTSKKQELAQGEAKLISVKQNLDNKKKQLLEQEEKLKANKIKAENEFENAHNKLEASKVELQKGINDYEKGKKESDEKIAEGYQKLSDAEEEVKKLEKPLWYVLDRNMQIEFVDYGKAAERVDAIAQVFPVFFFLIAALVCLTTMTRMVDEQRIYIGTLKALGYSKFSIAAKYMFYAMFASASGSIFGLLIGFQVFPTVIYNAYRIMYTMPSVITEFNLHYAILSTACAVLSTTIATWFACYKELMETPATLMRPKAPKAGKRIFLERIKFIWTRLNFTHKVTARNLFRYKKRFIMTILGIGGCTALLLSGFGLKDSIVSIVSKQYYELYNYQMIMSLEKETYIQNSKNVANEISNDSRIGSHIFIKEQSINIGKEDKEKTAFLFVPEDTKKVEDFIIFRNRVGKEKLSLTDEGVILTEKIAKMLQAKVGDEIYIKDGETKKLKVKITGITENYLSHYVYMSPRLYERIYGKKIKFQQILAKTGDTSDAFQDKLSIDILKSGNISSVSFTSGISGDFQEMIGSLNYVILVLIVSAGALAFVVLYNLTNVNVTERLREIATIKVLGFYDREVSAYVYRENIILTVIGMLIGLVLGIFFHKFIIVTAEIDYIMFGREIKALSFLYAAILTMVFTGVVNFVMYFTLKKIGMVESLKSVD